MAATSERIDIHHHMLCAEYEDALHANQIADAAGNAFPLWSAEQALEFMDRNRIGTAILGLSHPGVPFDRTTTVKTVAVLNEHIQCLAQAHPRRFYPLGILPLPYMKESLAQARYLFEEVGIEGVSLLSCYQEDFLGTPEQEPLWELLDSHRAVVHVHPTLPKSFPDVAVPGWSLEFVFDSTRVITSLAARRVFKRYPHIRFVFSHGGGCMPYIARRIARGVERVDPSHAYDQLMTEFQNLYFDTALTDRHQFSSLLELVDTKHILFGTDYNFAAESQTVHTIASVDNYPGFSSSDRTMIYRGNALRLFPGLSRILE